MYYVTICVFEMSDDHTVPYRLNKRHVLHKANTFNFKMFLVGLYQRNV